MLYPQKNKKKTNFILTHTKIPKAKTNYDTSKQQKKNKKQLNSTKRQMPL